MAKINQENLKSLLLSEIYSQQAYVERLLHAFYNLTDISHTPKAKNIMALFYEDVCNFINNEILSTNLEVNENEGFYKNTNHKEISEISEIFKDVFSIVKSTLNITKNNDKNLNIIIEFINLVYQNCQQLHQFCKDNTNLDIQYPRGVLLDSNIDELMATEDSSHLNEDSQYEQEDSASELGSYNDEAPTQNQDHHNEVPMFSLLQDRIIENVQNSKASLSFLDKQRERKYEQFLHIGHEFIFEKKHENALEAFQKAKNYQETAEIITLIGWTYSMLGQIEKAKSFCLDAIQKDPDYGPPYNDLGTYLLNEGQINESLKWFELAKNSINYQNKEYPYINAGRAYMMKKEYDLALEEFSKALTLAPYHEELHNTVNKLKKSVNNEVKNSTNSEFFNIDSNLDNKGDLPPSIF